MTTAASVTSTSISDEIRSRRSNCDQDCHLTGLPKPIEAVAVLSETWVSSPLKAPPTMNRISLVSRATISPLGFLRPPFSGTFTVVPSSIFSKACCTPSPLTSLVMLMLLSLITILSICTCHRDTVQLPDLRMLLDLHECLAYSNQVGWCTFSYTSHNLTLQAKPCVHASFCCCVQVALVLVRGLCFSAYVTNKVLMCAVDDCFWSPQHREVAMPSFLEA